MNAVYGVSGVTSQCMQIAAVDFSEVAAHKCIRVPPFSAQVLEPLPVSAPLGLSQAEVADCF